MVFDVSNLVHTVLRDEKGTFQAFENMATQQDIKRLKASLKIQNYKNCQH